MMIKKSILLVDDDQRLRELLKDYLTEKNFQVFTSEDFNEAREILGFFIFDLIILDRMMPSGDGINLIQDIKQKILLKIKKSHIPAPASISITTIENELRSAGFEVLKRKYIFRFFSAKLVYLLRKK